MGYVDFLEGIFPDIRRYQKYSNVLSGFNIEVTKTFKTVRIPECDLQEGIDVHDDDDE